MKAVVMRTCGHEEQVEVFGPRKDREWRLEREKEKLCTACWKAQQERERAERERKWAAARAEGAELAKQLGLPELQGTPRQIAWATEIRGQRIRDLIEIMGNVDIDSLPGPVKDMILEQDASRWIQHRDVPTTRLMFWRATRPIPPGMWKKMSDTDPVKAADVALFLIGCWRDREASWSERIREMVFDDVARFSGQVLRMEAEIPEDKRYVLDTIRVWRSKVLG